MRGSSHTRLTNDDEFGLLIFFTVVFRLRFLLSPPIFLIWPTHWHERAEPSAAVRTYTQEFVRQMIFLRSEFDKSPTCFPGLPREYC